MKTILIAMATVALAGGASAQGSSAPLADWRSPAPENLLVIDTTKGRIVVEMRPEFAPNHVERVRLLTREKLYDGLHFHRVIDWFMAQTGDPGNVDGGKSSHPDLKPEFIFRRSVDMPTTIVARPAGTVVGFIGAQPFQGNPDEAMARAADGKASAWGLYCAGVVGAGRGEAEDSANSEFFLTRHPYPALDKRYTVWGKVLVGLDVVRALKTGEPVKDPDVMTRVQIASDMAPADRPRLQVADTRGPAFQRRVAAVRKAKGADFSVCDLDPRVRTLHR